MSISDKRKAQNELLEYRPPQKRLEVEETLNKKLPPEILHMIFELLSIQALTAASSVCQSWNSVANPAVANGFYWQRVVNYKLGQRALYYFDKLVETKEITWREVARWITPFFLDFLDKASEIKIRRQEEISEESLGKQGKTVAITPLKPPLISGRWLFRIINSNSILILDQATGLSEVFEAEQDVCFTHLAYEDDFLFALTSEGCIFQIRYKKNKLVQFLESSFYKEQKRETALPQSSTFEPTLPQSCSFRGGLGKLSTNSSCLDGGESHALQGRVLQLREADYYAPFLVRHGKIVLCLPEARVEIIDTSNPETTASFTHSPLDHEIGQIFHACHLYFLSQEDNSYYHKLESYNFNNQMARRDCSFRLLAYGLLNAFTIDKDTILFCHSGDAITKCRVEDEGGIKALAFMELFDSKTKIEEKIQAMACAADLLLLYDILYKHEEEHHDIVFFDQHTMQPLAVLNVFSNEETESLPTLIIKKFIELQKRLVLAIENVFIHRPDSWA